MLGCSQNGNSNSVIIDATSSPPGKVLKTLFGLGGTDEVWFNWGDWHYVFPHCPATCRNTTNPTPQKAALVDSQGIEKDKELVLVSKTVPPLPTATGNFRRIKSVAADPITNQVFMPIPAIGGTAPVFAPNICSTAPKKIGKPTDANGCLAVFTTSRPKDND